MTSSFGRVLTAIREDEQAIEVFGYRATHFKLVVWTVSAMMAGLAGGLFASWTSFIDPNSFILLESMLLVCIVILGGLATIWGSLLGAMAFVLLEEGMRFLPFIPGHVCGTGEAGRSGRHAGTADAVQAAGPSREVQAVRRDPGRSASLRPRDEGDIQALWGGQGRRSALDVDLSGMDYLRGGAERVGEVDTGKPA